MKIYVASSWRNEERQQLAVAALRADGHQVYDFRNPPGRTGFGWSQCATEEELKDPKLFRQVLDNPIARAAFDSDMTALAQADATVLVLPCGRSAHLELGFASMADQHTIVVLDEPISEPELMYLMCTEIVTSIDEARRSLALLRAADLRRDLERHAQSQRTRAYMGRHDVWRLP